MSLPVYFATVGGYPGKWCVYKRTRTGDRRIAAVMSERSARRVARLLNESEAQSC